MQKLLIEVSHQDQIYVENQCTTKGLTLSNFFLMLLNEHRDVEGKKLEKEGEWIQKEKKALEEERNALEEEKGKLKAESDALKEKEGENFPCDSVDDFIEKPKRGRKKKSDG